ncbi:hypothetical protein SCP_0803650 [Sparassis crispa]|uniref:Uncharacterized protein n=1 Tax=Sparassis crispa TaxID=139825 RepID=A0A401GUI4_9APHY|nr:hypothetical protein SCP_0803650 [Sparassis crispa]GBE85843.1 hypothetical protein SCP_0803650 [Sparassis crispa]
MCYIMTLGMVGGSYMAPADTNSWPHQHRRLRSTCNDTIDVKPMQMHHVPPSVEGQPRKCRTPHPAA